MCGVNGILWIFLITFVSHVFEYNVYIEYKHNFLCRKIDAQLSQINTDFVILIGSCDFLFWSRSRLFQLWLQISNIISSIATFIRTSVIILKLLPIPIYYYEAAQLQLDMSTIRFEHASLFCNHHRYHQAERVNKHLLLNSDTKCVTSKNIHKKMVTQFNRQKFENVKIQ